MSVGSVATLRHIGRSERRCVTDGNETLGEADLTNWRNGRDTQRKKKFGVVASEEEEKEAIWES